MHGLLERVERDQPERRLQGVLGGPGPALLREQLGQGLEGELPQPVSLGHEPVLEERAAEGEALQELAPVESGRPRQGIHVTHPREALKRFGVHVARVRVEGKGLAGQGQARWVRRGQGSA